MIQHEEHTPEWEDPIVAEVRRVREALFAAADYDLGKLCKILCAEQAQSGHHVVRRGRPVDRGLQVGLDEEQQTRKGALLEIAGIGASGLPDLGRRHDHYLSEEQEG